MLCGRTSETHAKEEKLCTQDNMCPNSTHMECSGKAIGDWKRGKQISDHMDLGKKMEMSVNEHEVIWRWQKCFQGSLWDDATALVQLQENC